MFSSFRSKRLLVTSQWMPKTVLNQVLLAAVVWSLLFFTFLKLNRDVAIVSKPCHVSSKVTGMSLMSFLLKNGEQMMNTKVNNSNDHSSEKDLAARRELIKDMMRHAWNGYVRLAWGENEFRPLTGTRFSPYFLSTASSSKLGLTIVDALDTLYIMDLKDEFQRGRQWIKDNLNWDNVFGTVSVFEVTIRFVGGLLSSYALTNDTMFLQKAEHVASKLLPAFQTKTGLPTAEVSLNNEMKQTMVNSLQQVADSPNLAAFQAKRALRRMSLGNGMQQMIGKILQETEKSPNLAEVGSSHLEFVYLSDVTGNRSFKEHVKKARDVIYKATPPDGLYPDHINVYSGEWMSVYLTFGARADSFYEYLLKAWIQSNGEDWQAKDMFMKSMEGAKKKLWQRSKGGLFYLAEMPCTILIQQMGHLTCFAGGMFALAAKEMSGNVSKEFLKMGEELARTCHESYVRTATGLGPEKFSFAGGAEAKSTSWLEYILRPEVVETYFYLWRITKNEKYRNWAWDVVMALNEHCRVTNGFVGIRNVYKVDSDKDDVQQSFFLAETLKYLYLIFADDLLPLDKWVFNTEAHPLPIKDRNDAYRRRFDYQPV